MRRNRVNAASKDGQPPIDGERRQYRFAADTLMSSRQVAELLGIHPDHVCRMRKTGSGPSYVKIGKAVRYHPREIELYLARNRFQSTSEY